MSTFVSIGNGVQDFSRLLNEIKRIQHLLPQPVIVQHGRTPFDDPTIRHFRFVDASEFQTLLQNCKVFITHGGGGSVFAAIKFGKKAVVFPRRQQFGEVIDDHQVVFATELRKMGQIELVEETSALLDAVNRSLAAPELPPIAGNSVDAVEVVDTLMKRLAPHKSDAILLVTPPGGHLDEIKYFNKVYCDHPHHFVLNKEIIETQDTKGRVTVISYSERDWRFLLNLYEAWALLKKHKARVILTTGGGFSVAFALAGKLLGIPTVYIETWAKIGTPTATGRVMYRLTPHFFYQWPQVAPHFPNATHIGLLV